MIDSGLDLKSLEGSLMVMSDSDPRSFEAKGSRSCRCGRCEADFLWMLLLDMGWVVVPLPLVARLLEFVLRRLDIPILLKDGRHLDLDFDLLPIRHWIDRSVSDSVGYSHFHPFLKV